MTAIFYALITSIATIIGGLLPLHRVFRKINFKYLIGFSAGSMIAIVFFDLLPEVKPDSVGFVALGFFLVYVIEKFVLLHTCSEADCKQHTLAWPSMIGVGAESLCDGIAIATGYAINPKLGLAIVIAIISHEIPRGFTTTVIMKKANKKGLALISALAIDAGFTPLGAIIGLMIPNIHLESILSFTAGTFIYIGASDLLPEAHKKFNIGVILSVFAGVLLIFGLSKIF